MNVSVHTTGPEVNPDGINPDHKFHLDVTRWIESTGRAKFGGVCTCGWRYEFNSVPEAYAAWQRHVERSTQ